MANTKSYSTDTISVNKITVKKRIRQEKGDLNQLKQSIQKVGLLNSIIVDENYQLIAGERRLMAVKELGWERVSVKVIKKPSQYSKIMMELEENFYRKDFTADEIIKGMALKEKLRKKERRSTFFHYWNMCLNWFKSIFEKIFKQWK